ncbi:peptidoglycan editing factor PgeF [Salinisphaera sp. SPP-AMP-43]|uniref:peptidoglycan editing factor PgeF n=1 Tax=Salinisphaera sp. SPP-AMP-43 TaxID=3121288 RepID=UPI003C6E53A7
MNPARDFLWADWPAPPHIRAGTTLRSGGFSLAPYDQLNLGTHTGDRMATVRRNRDALRSALALPGEPVWLNQIHGTGVVMADAPASETADASVAQQPATVCAVLTADCLPVVFCNLAGSCWAVAHAGWRGLAAGVLEATVGRLPARSDQLMVWLGPAIGPAHFEVGAEVRDAFQAFDPAAEAMFVAGHRPGHYFADIYALARARLQRVGIDRIYGGGQCTVDDSDRFYSYRRGSPTGRMATLVWSTTG